jgi:NADH-quinone oxidoreductase subunit J
MDATGEVLAFWALAALTLVAASGVIVSRNLLHAVLFLITSFLGVAGFFVLLSAPFLAMAQIIIYVGAIAVLVLFAVLLTPRAGRDNSETSMFLPATALSIALFAIIAFVVYDTEWRVVTEVPQELTVRDLGNALLTTWVLPFQAASVLLTAALIGAIMLARSPAEEEEDRER